MSMHGRSGGDLRGTARGLVFAFVAAGCVASRGPSSSHDGGADGGDARSEAASCTPPKGGNDLSFDLSCTEECISTTHFDFHLDPTAKGYPGCAEGTNQGTGIFQFPNLSGMDDSTLELNLEPYDGKGSYIVSAQPGFFSLSAMIPLEGGVCEISSIIPAVTGDAALGGTPPTCTFVVTDDCADGVAHTVTGTFECTLPNAVSDGNCTIDHGTFSFADCTP
jgi:hypothetical protein